MKEITCIICPIGCKILIDAEKITNYKCKRGLNYAFQEIKNPKRILTTTLKADGLSKRRVAVRLNSEIPKEAIFKVLKEIKKIKITKKVKKGEIILENVLNLGVNLISQETVD
ncbi:MAG: DUF1667 domain-containing protein [Caldisericia bacterium]|jgi:CxxC motif-containing protein|nr:DUF1667 domain-containing protein [Caldisericia bacterium]